MPRVQHPETGQFSENWMFEEPRSDGSPPEKLFLPSLPPPWKSRWYRKRGRTYVDASRGRLNGRHVRICRRLGEIRDAVATKEREILEHGQLAVALTTAQRWMAAEAFLVCERLGVELIDVIRDFEKTHPHGANARTLDQVRLELVASKRKLKRSERHVHSLDYRLRRLIAGIGNKPVTAITTKDLQDEIERHPGWGPRTVASATQGWKVGLNFAIRQGYLLTNPANKLDLPTVIREEPRILSLKEARTLMAATLFCDRDPLLPHCRAYLAIGMFAGIRPEEMVRLDWQHIDLATGSITITGANAKCRARRMVDIAPNLAAWLKPLARARGAVLQHPIHDLRRAARGVLGMTEWPHDVLRHTFGSYHFAFHRNEALVKNQMGHSDDGRMFFHHYRVMVHRAVAVQFWGIVPPVDVLPCYDAGWAESHPPARLVVSAHGAPPGVRRAGGTGKPAQESRL